MYTTKGLDHLKSECNDFTRDFINKLCDEEILRSEEKVEKPRKINSDMSELNIEGISFKNIS